MISICITIILFQITLQKPGQWEWVSGDAGTWQRGRQGEIGVPSTNIWPSGRVPQGCFNSATNKFYTFSGIGVITDVQGPLFNLVCDLWSFEPTTNRWTRLEGDSTLFACSSNFGKYADKGVFSNSAHPSWRYGANLFCDSLTNQLLLFGGRVDRDEGQVVLNDLWAYDVSSDFWKWASGNDPWNANEKLDGIESRHTAVGILDEDNQQAHIFGGVFSNTSNHFHSFH
jgi:N-acetylneuraminic acid mutarotase